jgi:hypothetical protein
MRFVKIVVLLGLFVGIANAQSEEKVILNGSVLSKGFGMGVDSSDKKRDWLTREPEYMKMSFPAYQEWAAVFVTVGRPKDPPRPDTDLSAYKALVIEMRGQSGGEVVEIGIKSSAQPDTGEETKMTVKLDADWKLFSFPLSKFDGADLKHIYVVAEFVYNDKTPQTIYFKNIKYVK